MLAKLKMHARLIGKLQVIKRNAAYKQEGDPEMDTPENLARRQVLKSDPTIQKSLEEFWDVMDLVKVTC